MILTPRNTKTKNRCNRKRCKLAPVNVRPPDHQGEPSSGSSGTAVNRDGNPEEKFEEGRKATLYFVFNILIKQQHIYVADISESRLHLVAWRTNTSWSEFAGFYSCCFYFLWLQHFCVAFVFYGLCLSTATFTCLLDLNFIQR